MTCGVKRNFANVLTMAFAYLLLFTAFQVCVCVCVCVCHNQVVCSTIFMSHREMHGVLNIYVQGLLSLDALAHVVCDCAACGIDLVASRH